MTRSLVLALAILAFAVASTPGARADEVAYCWYEGGGNRGGTQQIHCRLVGGEEAVYSDRGEIPDTLFPAVGTDGNGECWYERTVFTGWVSLGMDGTRNLLWFDPDGTPGGPLLGDAWFERCESEPWEIEIVHEIVWGIIESFDFAEPDAVLNPEIGVTGLPTYVAAMPPEPVVETVVSPATGRVVSVEFVVSTVSIEWGDGDDTEIPPAFYESLTGYPDGDISHTYETSAFLDPVVSFDWRVRWRVDDEPWQTVTGVEPTTWTDTYQVDEIVGRVTG